MPVMGISMWCARSQIGSIAIEYSSNIIKCDYKPFRDQSATVEQIQNHAVAGFGLPPRVDFPFPFPYHLPMKPTESRKQIPCSAYNTIRKVERFAVDHAMLAQGDHVLVAVSGGADSTALLHILAAHRKHWELSLHVAHLNHNLRGDESSADASFVEEEAKRLGLPVTVETLAKGKLSRKGRAKQDLAREVRYEFLQRTAKEAGCSKIATGHTADDVAETVLMALIRGGGTRSLGGIPPVRQNVIRPLLCLERREIAEFLAAQGIGYREDSSNRSTHYLRNKVRLELIPFLKERFNPSITATLARTAEVVRDDAALLEEEVEGRLLTLIDENGGGVVVPIKAMETLRPAARRRIIRGAWQRIMDASDVHSLLSAGHVASILSLALEGKSGDSLCMPGGVTVKKCYGELRLLRPFMPASTTVGKGPWFLREEGTTSIPALGIEVQVSRSGQRESTSLWTAAFDSGKLNNRIFVRTRQTGDTFCPAGMGGARKKLQDFLVDAKVPRGMRDSVPLVCCGADIIWVAGHRADERFMPSLDTTSFVTIKINSGGQEINALR